MADMHFLGFASVFRSFSTAPISATLRSTRGGGRATGRAVLYAGRMCSFFRYPSVACGVKNGKSE